MPRYKSRNRTDLANSSEGIHPVTSKRKLEQAETENEYSEEPGNPQTSKRNSKEKDVNSKDVNLQKNLTNLKRKRQRKLPPSKTSCKDNESQINSSNSSPELMKSKKVFQQLDVQKHNKVGLSSTKMKNHEFVNTLPNSNCDDPKSQVPNIPEHTQITPKMKNLSGKCKTGTKMGVLEAGEKDYEFQGASIISSSAAEITPHIKYVAQTNSRTKNRPSKTHKKGKESHSSSINTSPDIVEMIDIFNQVKNYCFKNKKVTSHKTKPKHVESQSTSSTSNPCDSKSNIPCVQESIEVTQQIKRVSQTHTHTKEILSTTCNENDNFKNTYTNSSINVTETNDVTTQVKTKLYSTKRRRTKDSPNLNTGDLESNISNAEVSLQFKHGPITYAGTKNIFSKTCKKNNNFPNSSINVTGINDVTSQVKTKLNSAKTRKAKASSNLNTGDLESNISNAEEPAEVIPLIKHVARTYSRTKERLSKTCEKNDGLQSSSLNLYPRIPETKDYFPQVKQCGVKKYNTRSLSNVKITNESKNGLRNSISDAFESSIAVVQELNEKVSPKIKQSAAKKHKRQSLVNIKPRNVSKNGLLNSFSGDCEPSIADVQELNEKMSPQIKLSAAKNHKKQSLVNIKPTNLSKKGLLNSFSGDCEPSIADVQELNDEVSPQIKPLARKCKKVCFSAPCVDELLSNSSNSTIDISESEMPTDFLPIITKSCGNRLKSIVSTAVQIQRHSHRRILTETDFIKALTFHNCFDDDILEHKIDSETIGNESSEFISFTCQGKWLHK